MASRVIRLRAIGPEVKRWESENVLHIGRMSTMEVVLDDPSISRRHAEIEYTDLGWVVRNLGSSNGTFVNGTRIGRTQRLLRADDILQCGNVVLAVEALTDEPLDLAETPAAGLQVQAVMRQSLEEAANRLAMDVTRSTRPGEQLLKLLQAGQYLDHRDSFEELLQRNLREIVQELGAKRGAVILLDENNGKPSLHATFPAELMFGATRCYSQTLAARCLSSGQSLLCADRNDPVLCSGSLAGLPMSSIICALLRSPDRNLGILHLDRGPNDEPFTRDNLRRADALAATISFALESAQLQQQRQRALFVQTLIAFSQAIEMRDPYTGGHTQRVTDYSLLLAKTLKVSATDHYHLRIGAPLHDIGKIGITDAILNKTGPLTPAELEMMKLHTVKGAAILESLPGLESVIPIVRNHHERWDGKGYPDQLAGENIPRLARLVAVADSFDAMTTNRPYRSCLSVDQAMTQIERGAGTQFDPEFTHAFVGLRDSIEHMMGQHESMLRTDEMILFLPERATPPRASRRKPEPQHDPRPEPFAFAAASV